MENSAQAERADLNTEEQATPPQTPPDEQARYWMEEIRLGQRAVEKWHERGDKIIVRYKDERDTYDVESRRLNILWSNVETLSPVVYARTPKPEVQRRFLDKDPVGKVAAEVLERATAGCLDQYDYDGVLQLCVKDYLLPGRGQAWLRYEPEFGQDGSIAYEKCVTDYVHWKDFLTNAARTWSEVRWCGRRSFLTRDELVKLAGEDIGRQVPLDHKPNGVDESDAQKMDKVAKATVWEIWDKPTGQVWFIHPTWSNGPLKVVPAPFKLDGFFPCPRPLTTTTATDSIVPVPDYCEYQDQAEELDDLTRRIAAIQKSLKVVGCYDSSLTALQNILTEGYDNVFVPVDNWAAFAQKAGLQGGTSFLPLKEVADTLIALYEARQQVKNDLYEVTGISDILRGESDASETATAQSIKAQWGSIRVRDRQKEVARFARDIIRIKAEIIAEVFEPQTIAQMSGIEQMGPDYQKAFPQAVELLRNGAARNFRIDIETDSTIQPDEQEEKQSATEFLQVFGGFLKEGLPAAQMAPPLIPVMGEILLATVRRFRFGRQMEGMIEQAVGQMTQMAQQAAANPPPDPAQQEIEVMREKAGAEIQIAREKAGNEMQIAQVKAQNDMQVKQQTAAANAIIKANQPPPHNGIPV